MKSWIVCITLLLPSLALGCEFSSQKCEAAFLQLLSYRHQAIEGAFGDLSMALPAELRVEFVASDGPELRGNGGSMAYDSERNVLLVPRSLRRAQLPNPLRAALYYWPFYRSERDRAAFPVVEQIDDALWSIFLQESAHSHGEAWPPRNCNSAEPEKRLPCRMLLTAAARLVKVRNDLFFNENRIDRIWPDHFSAFQQRNFRDDDPTYADVLRLGGILLLRPLISEFGVPRVLAYIAQTPLQVENDSLRISALRYQERARSALLVTPSSTTGVPQPSHPPG